MSDGRVHWQDYIWNVSPLFEYLILLKTGSLDNAIQDFLLALPLWYSQYNIISKYGKRTLQLKFKKGAQKFSLTKEWRPATIASHRS